jgi:hypothetical protein
LLYYLQKYIIWFFFFCISLLRVELVVNERKIGSCRPGGAGGNHARHLSLIYIVSYPFISLQFIEYIVTGDSVYYSGSLPLVEVVYKLYSANVNIQNVNWTESNVYSPGTWVARTVIYALLGCQQCLYICCGKIIVNNILKFKGVVSLFLMTIMCKV